jgi:hypothetical protein
MTEEIKAAIQLLAQKISAATTPEEALKFTQAALNLAHTAATLHHMK